MNVRAPVLAIAIVLAACRHEATVPVLNASIAGRVPAAERLELASADADATGVVVRTRAGNLVRYDRTLAFVTDAVLPSPAVALALPYVALASGEIARLDPRTLALTPIAQASGTPLWLAPRGAGVVAFVERERRFAIDVDGESFDVSLGDSAAAHVGKPSAFFLDGDVVWFGVDAGEWGGLIGRVDLATRTTRVFDDGDAHEPVYGFAKHPDGRTLFHGGLAHMGSRDGAIAAIDTAVTPLWHRQARAPARTMNEPPGMPIVAIRAERDHLLVLAWRELYAVSADFARWTKLVALPARARAGRPDAMGSYPAVVAMLAVGDAVVFATTRDGLLAWRGRTLARVAP